MTYHNYQWTAYKAADFQDVSGTYHGEFTTGSKLTISGSPSVTMQTYDDDGALNGDNGWFANDQSEDWYGQDAYVNGARIGGQMYAEEYYAMHGSDGKVYYMINIEVEGCQGSANGEYYTFYGAVPPAGVELTVAQVCNVSGSWVDYDCIGAGETAPPNTPPHFTNVPSQGCLTIDENKGFVIDLNASDDDGDALSFAIVGGDDAHLFEIDADTGELTFKSAPDYENPADCDGDNTYDVKVKVSDGKGGYDVKCLCVRVEDDTTEPETGVISGRFFVDADCNGSEWNDVTCNWDGAVPHATVELLDLNGDVVATTTTDSQGNYSFEAPTGQYYVRFAAQDGKSFVEQGQGKDLGHGETADMNDSDAGALGLTDVITLTKGGQTNVDAGVGTCSPIIGKNCVVIEAEDMHLSGFCIGDASSASGGQYVSAHSGYTGSASTIWAGDSGTCDITVTAWDAPSHSWWSSASEKVYLYVNGKCVGSYALTHDNCDWRDITFKDVQLNAGDKIEIYANGQNCTVGAIDKIKICCDVTDPVSGKIGDLVFLDADKDGIQDAGEAGAAGVMVKLLDADTGQVLAITETDANGAYLFENLPAGDYKVMVSPGADYAEYVFTDANQGNDDSKDSDVNAAGVTDTITLAAGETNLDVDAGLAENTGSLAGTLFRDVNKSDVEDAGDERVPGKTVVLFEIVNGQPVEVARQLTDANGDYKFTDLDAGTYVVGFLNPQTGETFIPANQGNDDTIDSDVVSVSGGNGFTGAITLAAGEDKTDVDAGIADPGTAKITGRLFEDSDRDGIEDAGEPGVPGVTVILRDGAGTEVDRTTTGTDGSYSFDGLDAGDYVVEFPTEVNGKKLTDSNVGNDDTVDSDADQGTGKTGVIELEIGEQSDDNDTGIVTPLGSLSGRYFLDQNDNSVQDAGDQGVKDVIAVLFDNNGQFVKSTLTDADGTYSFGDLEPGSYTVRFQDQVSGGVLVDQNQGSDDTVDSDAAFVGQSTAGYFSQITNIQVLPGQNTPNNDAGVELPGALEGRVFMDANDNDQDDAEMGVAGVTVILRDASGAEVARTVSGNDGSYSFDGLVPGDYRVEFVESTAGGKTLVAQNVGNDATDSDADPVTGLTNPVSVLPGQTTSDVDAGVEDPGTARITGRLFEDQDKDGIEEAGEPGVAGVTVTLTNEDTGETRTTVTGPDGGYAFNGLDAGDYTVSFPTEVDGKTLTDSNVGGDDTVDSDADQSTGKTGVIELEIGEQSDDNDAGIVDPGTASVGDTVFFDANGNGVFDAGDSGLAGVTVQLTGAGQDGLFGTADDTSATDTTDANGAYLFEGLNAGDYKVTFLRTGAAAGLAFTAEGAAADDAVNNDSDANAVTGMTDSFSLDIGEAERDIDAGLITPNTPPTPANDTGKICANTELTLDVLANDSDADGDSLTITEVGGQAISEGQTVTVDGVNITLSGGKLVFDGEDAFESLNLGEMATASFTYTVSDGQDTGTATVDVTVCGTAETLQEICESLPKDLVGYQVKSDIAQQPYGPDAFDVALQSSDARFNGLVITDAYCADFFRLAETASDFGSAPVNTANLYCATDPALANVLTSKVTGQANGADRGGETVLDNLDVISWIISQDFESKGTYTGGEIQAAIWEFTNDYSKQAAQLGITVPEFNLLPGTGDAAKVAELVNLAEVAGEGFVAGAGDRVALFLDPNPDTATNSQPIVFGVDFNDIDCLC